MNINVTTKNVTIDSENLNKGEYNIRECNFTFSEEYDGLVCKALFTVSKTKLTYEQSIVNNKCEIPYEATINRGKVILGVIGYEIEDEELVKRYSPKPDEFFVLDGSYVEDIENQATPTPSDLEQLEQRVSQVEIDAQQVEINTQDISDIKEEQITQNDDISDLQTNKADKTELPTKTSDLTNDNGFIDNSANNLTNYTLTTQTGSKIDLEINSSNYQLVAKLYDKNNTLISTSTTIDLPIESMVVSATYDNTNKKIVLTLQNGQTIDVPVGDLVAGLVSDTDYATSSKGGVVKVDGSYGTNITNTGYLYSTTKSFVEYNSADGSLFISKRTLENVITGKNLETANNKVTSLSSSSTDTQYPSAKCVYDLVGNIETILEELDIRRWRSMSISTRITSMQEHIRDIYDTLELGGVDLTNVDKNLINISPKLRQKYLDYMNNGTQEIWNNWEKVTGTGSDIKLNNTVQAPMNIVVGGNSEQVQTSQSANLFDEDKYKNATYTTGTYKYTPIDIKGGRTLYFKASLKSGKTAISGLYLTITNVGTNPNQGIYAISISNGTIAQSLDNYMEDFTGYNELYLAFYPTSISVADIFDTYNLWVSTDNISYTPFVPNSPSPSYPQPITNVTGDVEVLVQNKNLAWNGWAEDFVSRINDSSLASIVTKDGKRCLKFDRTAGYGSYNTKYLFKTNWKENTQYTISCDLFAEGSGSYSNIQIRYTDGTFSDHRYDRTENNWKKYTLISTENKTIKDISAIYLAGVNYIDIDTFMVLEGAYTSSNIPTYTPHKEQTFTFPLGTQRMYLGDYLADDGIHHVRKQVVLDGSEDWIYSNGQFYITGTNYKTYSNGGRCYSSHFIGSEIDDTINTNLHMWTGNANFIICIYNDITSVADFKTWLSTHNVTVQYELAEEEITPYTTEQQQAYDEIKQAISYNEQTNISGTSDECNPILTAVALMNF